MTEEGKLPLSRNEAIVTLVMLVRMAAISPVVTLEETLEVGFAALMVLDVSSDEIEAATIYLSKDRRGKKKKP
jgi:hypothetical protein